MKMTWKCAESLMDILACVCISANGGVPKNGMDEQQMEAAQKYARNKFCEILNEWEDFTGEKWEIEEPRKKVTR